MLSEKLQEEIASLPKLREYPDEALSKPAVDWTDFSEEGQKELERIIVMMHRVLQMQTWGAKLGISANQIGLPHNICIVRNRVLINPSLHKTKAPPNYMVEGCYSLGVDAIYEVPRAAYGWLKWQNIKGEWQEEKVKGITAVIVQHELDHLQGKSCVESGKRIDVQQGKS